MNCLTCRRLLLASPREHDAEQLEHIATCASCGRLMTKLADLDRSIEDAALVPVPEALAHRVFFARRQRPVWRYAAAAVLVLAMMVSALVLVEVLDMNPLSDRVQAVGPAHPAVAAIAIVANDRLELAQEGDDAEMHHRLKQLGLELRQSEVHAYYAGKCHMSSGECDVIVLDTPEARATVVLVPDYPITARMVVADRRMIALANPARSGGYIVVADSPQIAKRMQRLFVRG